MTYRGGTYEQCMADDKTISANCGYPKNGTKNWISCPRKTIEDIWVYRDFPRSGRDGVTYEQATAGLICRVVDNVEFSEPEEGV